MRFVASSMLLAATLACAGGGKGGDDSRDFEGDDAAECSDGADNNQDGVFDCDDPGCAASPDCDGADADTDTDTDTDADTATGPRYDFSAWEGSRRFVLAEADCDDTVAESGFLVEPGSATANELAALCPTCASFYEVTPEQEAACDGYGLTTTWRGVVLDGPAQVYLFADRNGTWDALAEDREARFEGGSLTYAYTTDFFSYELQVTGVVTWPLVTE
jgi:hypothetical protein